MTYEIEGELEDPKTGEKLPFKAKFKMIESEIKDDTDDKCDNEHQDGAVTRD